MEFSDGRVGAVVQPCPRQSLQPVTYWVEIELLGENGEPIPWEEYRVVLQGGTTVKGYLDSAGFARIDGILSMGDCQICFPELDKDAWEKIAVMPEKGR